MVNRISLGVLAFIVSTMNAWGQDARSPIGVTAEQAHVAVTARVPVTVDHGAKQHENALSIFQFDFGGATTPDAFNTVEAFDMPQPATSETGSAPTIFVVFRYGDDGRRVGYALHTIVRWPTAPEPGSQKSSRRTLSSPDLNREFLTGLSERLRPKGEAGRVTTYCGVILRYRKKMDFYFVEIR